MRRCEGWRLVLLLHEMEPEHLKRDWKAPWTRHGRGDVQFVNPRPTPSEWESVGRVCVLLSIVSSWKREEVLIVHCQPKDGLTALNQGQASQSLFASSHFYFRQQTVADFNRSNWNGQIFLFVVPDVPDIIQHSASTVSGSTPVTECVRQNPARIKAQQLAFVKMFNETWLVCFLSIFFFVSWSKTKIFSLTAWWLYVMQAGTLVVFTRPAVCRYNWRPIGMNTPQQRSWRGFLYETGNSSRIVLHLCWDSDSGDDGFIAALLAQDGKVTFPGISHLSRRPRHVK